MIKCSECNHENETQRVYCHNCGSRLDRTTLVEEAQKPKKTAVFKKRLPSNGTTNSEFKTLVKTLVFALIAAAFVQAIRPPDGRPPVRSMDDTLVDAPSISVDLEEAATTPRRFAYSEAQLNAYLKNRVKAPKDPTLPTWVVTFNQAFANIHPGSARITKELLVFTLPCYLGGSYLPKVGSGSFQMKNIGGNIGRLPIHPLLFNLADDYIFLEFKKSMAEEAKNAAALQSIELKEKTILLTSGGKKA